MAGSANGHSRDQTTTDRVVERGPSRWGGPASVTGETVAALCRERSGGESHQRCQPELHLEQQYKEAMEARMEETVPIGSLFNREKDIPRSLRVNKHFGDVPHHSVDRADSSVDTEIHDRLAGVEPSEESRSEKSERWVHRDRADR